MRNFLKHTTFAVVGAFRKKNAESLIETIIAITVFTIGSTAAMSLVRVSLQGNESIGQKMIAMNLAMEGLEAVKNIRDTNYLRLASDPDNCWNTLSQTMATNCATAIGAAKVISDYDGTDATTYYLTHDLTSDLFEFGLRPISISNTGQVSLYTTSSEIDGDEDGDSEYYKLYAEKGITTSSGFLPETSIFSRTFTFEYLTDDLDNSLLATVTVSWEDGDEERSVTVKRILANIY